MNNLMSKDQIEEMFRTLSIRFEKHTNRHKGLAWVEIRSKLEENPGKMWSLSEMERTGGEPDVVGVDQETWDIIFMDCSAETPSGRRSLCYDQEALESRKKNKPEGSAMGMATEMGIELLTEDQYRCLQEAGEFDLNTSSWLQTPADVRQLGGAIFGDRRFGRVFIYHNGADSYYSARGFRGVLRV